MWRRKQDLTWAAGLFEGEGSVVVQRGVPTMAGTRRLYLSLQLGMNERDRDVIERFARVVGCGNVTGPTKERMLRWKVTGSRAMALADTRAFTEQLGARRKARLAEVVAAVRSQPPPMTPQESGRMARAGTGAGSPSTSVPERRSPNPSM